MARVSSGFLSMVPPLGRVGAALTGATGVRLLAPQVARLTGAGPGTPADLAGRAAGSIFLGWLGRLFFGRSFGEDMALGGLVITADEALRGYVFPQVGLSAYIEPAFGAYIDAPGTGIQGYIAPGAGVGWPGGEDVGDGLEGAERLDSSPRLHSGARLGV